MKFRIAEHDFYPENIAFDPVSGDYFLGSMAHARILRVHPDGSYEDFLSADVPELASSIGMKVDAERRVLWVCTGRFGLLADFDTTAARTGVLRFDVDEGDLIGAWILDKEQESEYHIFNDLVLTKGGEALITTTLLGDLWRVSFDLGEAKLLHQLGGNSHNNGITLSADERFVFFTVDRRIQRLDLATEELVQLSVPDDHDLGTDGLYFYDGALLAIKPRSKRIVRLALDEQLDTVTRVEILAADHPDFIYPTTGVIVEDRLVFVATSYADMPRKAGTAQQHPDILIYEVVLR